MSVTLLDGGMGQELIARCKGEPTGLWATQVMLDEPELVRAIHDDYFAAGADIATTNTYGLHRDRLIPNGLNDQFEDLHRIACRMAREARDAAGSGRVAGALGPLGWSYSHDGAPPKEEGAALFAEICEIQAPLVDLFLIETAASLEQVEAALMGTKGHGKPVWLALSVDDEDGTKLRSGEALSGIRPLVDRYGPDAVLLNCSVPEAIADGLPVLAKIGPPFGAYANGFTGIATGFTSKFSTVAQLSARKDLTPQAYADFCDTWVESGATIIGGCCEVGPAHIAELSRRLHKVPA
jgi:S-methylmethionine-dependent homocysteine/selenocysteine methylase